MRSVPLTVIATLGGSTATSPVSRLATTTERTPGVDDPRF